MVETVNLKTLGRLKNEKLRITFHGWKVWHQLVKRHDLSGKNCKTAVILMPRSDDENSYFALLYLDRMLHMQGFEHAIVLTKSSLVAEAATLMSEHILATELIDDKDIDGLLQYYALTIFDPRFFAAALEEPSGRNGKKLIGVHGITVEEMVAIGIYHIIPYVQKKRPPYRGENEKLRIFMALGGSYSGKRTKRIIQ